MGYKLELTVDAGTAEADAEQDQIRVYRGVLKSIFVHIPRGSARTLKFRVLVGSYQVFPRDPGSWFSGDFINHSFEIWYNMQGGSNLVTLEAYNTSTIFSRYVAVDVTVLSKWIAYPQLAIDRLRKTIDYLWGVLRKQ